MKKRVLAIALALCVSSVNVMGAFAAAPEGTTLDGAETVEEEGESASAESKSEKK